MCPVVFKRYKTDFWHVVTQNNREMDNSGQSESSTSSSDSLQSIMSAESQISNCNSKNSNSYDFGEPSTKAKVSKLRLNVMLNLSRKQPAMTARERVLKWKVDSDVTSTEVPFDDDFECPPKPSTSSGAATAQIRINGRPISLSDSSLASIVDLTDSPPIKRRNSNQTDNTSDVKIIFTTTTDPRKRENMKQNSSTTEENIRLWYSGSSPSPDEFFCNQRNISRDNDKKYNYLNTGILAKYTYLKGDFMASRGDVSTPVETEHVHKSDLNHNLDNDNDENCFKVPPIPARRVYVNKREQRQIKSSAANCTDEGLDRVVFNEYLKLNPNEEKLNKTQSTQGSDRKRRSLRVKLMEKSSPSPVAEIAATNKTDEKCKTENEQQKVDENKEELTSNCSTDLHVNSIEEEEDDDVDETAGSRCSGLVANPENPTNIFDDEEESSSIIASSLSPLFLMSRVAVQQPQIPPDKNTHVFEVYTYVPEDTDSRDVSVSHPSIIYLDNSTADSSSSVASTSPSDLPKPQAAIRKRAPTKSNFKRINLPQRNHLSVYTTRRSIFGRNGRKLSNFNKRNFMSLALKYPKRKKLISSTAKNNQLKTKKYKKLVSKVTTDTNIVTTKKPTTVVKPKTVAAEVEAIAHPADFEDKPDLLMTATSSKSLESSSYDSDENASKKVSQVTDVPSPMMILYSRISTDSALGVSILNSPSSRVSETANIMPNPLDSANGILHAAYFVCECQTVVVIQEKLISFWRYRPLLMLFGATPSWEFAGCITRKNHDIVVTSQNQNKLSYTDGNIVYLEIRARVLNTCDSRECDLSSIYANVYFKNEKLQVPEMRSIQLDTINVLPQEILFTLLKNSRYFVVSWTERLVNSGRKSGICKYCLTPNLDFLASIRDFPNVKHEIRSLQQLDDEKVLGIGDSFISIWNVNSGDLISCIDLKMSIGNNLTSYYCREDEENYLLLIQIIDSSLKLIAVRLNEFYSWKIVQSYQLPSNMEVPEATTKLSNIIFSTFKNNNTLLLTLNNLKNIYINHNHPNTFVGPSAMTKATTQSLASVTATSTTVTSSHLSELHPYLDYIVEISAESMIVKSIIEYFLDVKVT